MKEGGEGIKTASIHNQKRLINGYVNFTRQILPMNWLPRQQSHRVYIISQFKISKAFGTVSTGNVRKFEGPVKVAQWR